jgi:nitroreductase
MEKLVMAEIRIPFPPGPEPRPAPAPPFPPEATPAELLRAAAGYAVLAPSSHHTQPWHFRITEGAVEVYADRTRALAVVDPHDRELTISCGAALFFLRLALRNAGRAALVELLPDAAIPDLLARVRLGGPHTSTNEDGTLFSAVPHRHTNRKAFEPRAVPDAVVAMLEGEARAEGAYLAVIHGDERRHFLADLIAEGDRRQWESASFRRELAAWMHPSRAGDGLAADPLGAGPLLVRTFDLGSGVAARDRGLAVGSPLLAVLESEGDTVPDWLATGQALARLLLRARAEGVWASFLNQPVELLELRAELKEFVGAPGEPQLVLRLGYGPDVQATPRRPLEAVLIE